MKTRTEITARGLMLALATVALAAFAACGSEEEDGGGGSSDCTIGQPVPCVCPDGTASTATCLGTLGLGDCACGGGDTDAGGGSPTDVVDDSGGGVIDAGTDGGDNDGGGTDGGGTDGGGTDGGGTDGGGADAETGIDTPQFEDCTNGVDDDGDTLIDCADNDCAPAPECRNPPALVAYLADTGTFNQLFLGSTDGSIGPIQLESNAFSLQQTPAFSPDGRMVAYGHASQSEAELRVLNLETGEQTTVAVPGNTKHSHPNFSDDGTMLTFLSGASEGATQIYIYNLDTQTLDGPLTDVDPPLFVSAPVFTPDGSQLHYITGLGGSGADAYGDVWRMNVDGSSPEQVTSGIIFVGRLMANSARSTLLGQSLAGDIVTVDTGAGTVGFLSGTGSDSAADFLFGDRYVMASGSVGLRDIVVRDASGNLLGSVTATPDRGELQPAGSPVGLDAFEIDSSVLSRGSDGM